MAHHMWHTMAHHMWHTMAHHMWHTMAHHMWHTMAAFWSIHFFLFTYGATQRSAMMLCCLRASRSVVNTSFFHSASTCPPASFHHESLCKHRDAKQNTEFSELSCTLTINFSCLKAGKTQQTLRQKPFTVSVAPSTKTGISLNVC